METKYTLEQYQTLKTAYASGTLSVTYAGQTVVHRALSDMRTIMAEMENELGINPKPRQGPRSSPAYYSKGL